MLEQIGVVAAMVIPFGVAAYVLSFRDLIRRGRLHRRYEELRRHSGTQARADGRVACPECAEAVLPAARRCPYCQEAIAPRSPAAQVPVALNGRGDP